MNSTATSSKPGNASATGSKTTPVPRPRRFERGMRAVLQRPMVACCIVVRASDRRIDAEYDFLQPAEDAEAGEPHYVAFNRDLIQKLCGPVHIPWPGVTYHEAAAKLGMGPPSVLPLDRARRRPSPPRTLPRPGPATDAHRLVRHRGRSTQTTTRAGARCRCGASCGKSSGAAGRRTWNKKCCASPARVPPAATTSAAAGTSSAPAAPAPTAGSSTAVARAASSSPPCRP